MMVLEKDQMMMVKGSFDRRHGLIVGLMLAVAALVCTGCTASMKPGDLTHIQTTSDQPRAGNVYLLRGFIGIWSYGIDGIGQEINQSGIRANVYRCEQWREVTDAIIAKYKGQKGYEPLVIVGHSWGADHALDMAHALEAQHIAIDLIVTLDPVTPPEVPANVQWCYNIYQSHGAWDKIPFFRGVGLKAAASNPNRLENLNIRTDRTDLLEPDTDHYNIEKNPKIHREVLQQILKVCPPREQWVRQQSGGAPIAGMSVDGASNAVRASAAQGTKGASNSSNSNASNMRSDLPTGH